jgi:hypothetical protein
MIEQGSLRQANRFRMRKAGDANWTCGRSWWAIEDLNLMIFGHNLGTIPHGIFPVGLASLDETECPPYRRRPSCQLCRFDPAFSII